MKILKLMLVAVTVSTSTAGTVVNIYNLDGEWTEVNVSSVPIPSAVSASSCAYVTTDSNDCYYTCLAPDGTQSKSDWIANRCPRLAE